MRELYQKMMNARTLQAADINQMVNIYFKRLEKQETVNWDDFDTCLQQIVQFSMENNTHMARFIERHS